VAKDAARTVLLEEIVALENPEQYRWVLLMDADCVVLRNLDHLVDREEDLLISSRHAPDPGFLAVRGAMVKDLAVKWRGERAVAGERDHTAALATSLAAWGGNVGEFEKREVICAGAHEVSLADLNAAAVVHFGGLEPHDKKRLGMGFHLMTVYGDDDGLFLDMLES
jgi:hypothetical protein